jgi:hypothetical protein
VHFNTHQLSKHPKDLAFKEQANFIFSCSFAVLIFLNIRGSYGILSFMGILESQNNFTDVPLRRKEAAQREQHTIWYRKEGAEIDR